MKILNRSLVSAALMLGVVAGIAAADGPKRYVLKDDAKFDELCFNDETACISIARLKAAALVSKDESKTPFELNQIAMAAELTRAATLQSDLQDCDASRRGFRSQADQGIQNNLSQQLAVIERGLVSAQGGDYDKGDRLDWSTRKLIKKE